MKSFTVLSAKAKSNVGKTVTILEQVSENKVLVKMGRTTYEMYLQGKTLENRLNEGSVEWTRNNTTCKWADGISLHKVGSNPLMGGIMFNDIKINE